MPFMEAAYCICHFRQCFCRQPASACQWLTLNLNLKHHFGACPVVPHPALRFPLTVCHMLRQRGISGAVCTSSLVGSSTPRLWHAPPVCLVCHPSMQPCSDPPCLTVLLGGTLIHYPTGGESFGQPGACPARRPSLLPLARAGQAEQGQLGSKPRGEHQLGGRGRGAASRPGAPLRVPRC